MSSEQKMDESLTYEDVGHLLEAKGEQLVKGEKDPEIVIREVMENLAQSKRIRAREKTVDQNGRVSVGRDLSGVHGVTLFHPDPDEQDEFEGGERL